MEAAFKALAIVSFKDGQGGVEHLALGYDHDIEPRRDVVTTENLSYQSFRSVSLNRSPEFPGGRDSQPSHPAGVPQDEHGAVAAMAPDALFVHMLELGATANALVRAKGQRLSGVRRFGLD